MDKNKKIALEFAKILIQKDNVIPISTNSAFDHNSIQYRIGDKDHSFFELVSHFLEAINKIDKKE